MTFGLTAAVNALREERPDVLIIETWPLIATQLAMLVAWFWGVPTIYYVKDVYPEAAEQLGVIRERGLLGRLLRAWDRVICLQSSRVVAISENMRDLICRRGVGADRVTVIPDWLDADEFPLRPKDNLWRSQVGLPESRFVALFAGTIGLVSGANILVEVAEILKLQGRVLLLCVGEGALKMAMVEEAARRGLTNLRFEPFQPQESLADMHGAADALLLTMRDNPYDSSVPSKLISYLASGRPIICSANARSTVARIVRNGRAGIVVPPSDPRAIADAILQLVNDPAAARNMGNNARNYFEEHFTLDRAFTQFSQLLGELVGQRSTQNTKRRGTVEV